MNALAPRPGESIKMRRGNLRSIVDFYWAVGGAWRG